MLTLSAICVLPGRARAQVLGAVAGEVTDATGAVLPGVTVEVASPALIEGARTVVTDGAGRYNVVSLVPGTYTVTFTLAGFSVVKREGLALSAGFTAPVNAVMKVGSLVETVTVTGASLTVDVRNVRTQSVLNDETLNRLPSGAQNLSALFAATLSISMASIAGNPSGIDVGGSGGEMGTASVHNGRSDDMKITREGMNTMNSRGTNGGILHFGQHYNMEAVSEVTMGFGTPLITTFFSPDVLTKNRGYTWQLSAAVDRELRDNVRVSVSYFRTAHFNQTVIDNETVTPASYDPYCVTAPATGSAGSPTSHLPGGRRFREA